MTMIHTFCDFKLYFFYYYYFLTKKGLDIVCKSLDFNKFCIYWTPKLNYSFWSENKNKMVLPAFKGETTLEQTAAFQWNNLDFTGFVNLLW